MRKLRALKLSIIWPLGVVVMVCPRFTIATDSATPLSGLVKTLMTRELAGDSEKEALMLTVTYRPAAASLPHRHDAQVFVYVLQGRVTMQLDGSAPVTLGPGGTFYEGPNDVHRISANASRTAPAKILVFMIKDKNTPITRVVTDRETR